MSGYRRYNRSTPRPARWLDVKYAGTCHVCGSTLAVGARAFYDPALRSLTCANLACAEKDGLTRSEWHGAPTSGKWCEVYSPYRIGSPYPGAPPRRGSA